MQNTRLIELLKFLSDDEISAFGRFVSSPYYNRLKMVTKLFHLLKKHHPHFDTPQIKKEKIFKKLYPGQRYNDAKIRNLSSDLHELVLNYLKEIALEKSYFNQNIFLLHELSDRGIPKLFEKIYDKTKKQIDESEIKDEKFYFNNFEFENSLTPYLQQYKNDTSVLDKNQESVADNLTAFFIVSVLKIYTWMLNQQKSLYRHQFHNLHLLDEVISHISKNREKYESNLYVNVYYNIVKLLTSADEEFYYNAKNLLRENIKHMDKLAVKNLFTILGNYCHDKINKGNRQFEREIFELDKERFRSNVHKSEFIPYSIYRNFVIHSINVGEYEWAEKFLNEFRNNLPRQIRASAHNCGNALLHLWRKEYDLALSYLAKTGTSDLSFKLDIKSITAMIYFEQNQIESLLSLLDSYKHLLSNNKLLSETYKPFYASFTKSVEKLIKLRDNPDEAELLKLKKEILSKPSFYKVWLIKQTENLLKLK